ncbi:MAG: SusD/RagB family nutrient-binding outer membrane lipoprotein [Filimonas sp.]|nr:SusD/RagB family nutrient-binding outer membrane lipoprotein [Filimonas sp.]
MKKIIALSSIAAALAFGSCKKGYLDINTNPNSPTVTTPELLTSSTLNLYTTRLTTTLNQLGCLWSGMWANSADYLWYNDEKVYNISSSFYTGVWDDLYRNLNDQRIAENLAASTNKPYHRAIAKIVEASTFQILVDMYNNVPYSEALKNVNNLHPKYDGGQVIYEDLVKQLDSAISLIKTAPATVAKPGAEDIFMTGNMTKWIKYANTVKLRMLLRQSEMPGRDTYIKAQIQNIVTEGTGFIGAGETVYSNPGYTTSSGKQNPFWDTYYKTYAGAIKSDYKATRPTQFALNYYLNNNDPRLTQMYLKSSGTNIYKGIPLNETNNAFRNDSTSAFVVPATGQTGGLFKAATQPSVILFAAESLFLQAEAVQRGWLAGDAQKLYEAGIVESFTYLGVASPATAAATYYGQAINDVGWAASTNKMEAIITQKWLALNSISGMETWNDFRRLALPAVPLAKTKTQYPSRLMYPNSELGTNGDMVKQQNITDPFGQKIFWMK